MKGSKKRAPRYGRLFTAVTGKKSPLWWCPCDDDAAQQQSRVLEGVMGAVCQQLHRPEKASRVMPCLASRMLWVHTYMYTRNPQKTDNINLEENIPWHGHRELSTSVGARNDFASSNARNRSLSPSHSARHLKKKTQNQTSLERKRGCHDNKKRTWIPDW